MNFFKNLILKAKSPKGVAEEIRRALIKQYLLNPEYVYVWSPEESASRGYGNYWSVCAEEGPYEWAPNLTGYCKSMYDHPTVFGECYNNFLITFSKR